MRRASFAIDRADRRSVQSNYRPVDTDIIRERVLLNIDGAGDIESGEAATTASSEPDSGSSAAPSRSSPPSVGGLSSVYGKPVELEEMRSTTALQQPESTDVDVARRPSQRSVRSFTTADEHGLMTPPLGTREMPGSAKSFATARMSQPFVDVDSTDGHERL